MLKIFKQKSRIISKISIVIKITSKIPIIIRIISKILIVIRIISEIPVVIEVITKVSSIFIFMKIPFIIRFPIEQFKKIVKSLINSTLDIGIEHVFRQYYYIKTSINLLFE